MPPARRKPSGPSARGAQATLSFGNRAKVTKPSIAPVSKSSKPEPALPESVAKVIASPEPEAPTTAEIAIEEQAHAEIAKPKTEAEERAEKVTDAQIKRYWKSREDERKAARGKLDTDTTRRCYAHWMLIDGTSTPRGTVNE